MSRLSVRAAMSAAVIAACCLAGQPMARAASTPQAPLRGAGLPGVIPGHYIVVLTSDATASASSDRTMSAVSGRVRQHGGRVTHQFSRVLSGFSADLSGQQLSMLRQDPAVSYVEADRTVHASATQTGATQGLDRIDQRNLPLDGNYTFDRTGTGVTAFVIDTGIRATHTDFGGRVSGGFTAINDGNGTNDCNGHGTHVAGTIGSTTFGVAKAVHLVPVRVLDCTGSGSNSGVIAGIDWVTANHSGPSVANMSLGGGASAALDAAVNRSIASGVTYAVAAGNDNTDACTSSPARVPAAITVGAETVADARASFSNFGTCVDLFAPGVNITSTFNTSDAATAVLSGTSMATPHVTGVAALFLQADPTATPAQVASGLVALGTPDKISDVGTGSPNVLLFSQVGSGTGGGGTPNPAPSASASPGPSAPASTCAGATASFTGSLARAGSSALQPNGTFYRTEATGNQVGCLTGPAGADFDLYLYRWNGSAWTRVAGSDGTTATENVSFRGAAGFYVWQVVDFAGSGGFTLKIGHP